MRAQGCFPDSCAITAGVPAIFSALISNKQQLTIEETEQILHMWYFDEENCIFIDKTEGNNYSVLKGANSLILF